MCDVYNNLKEDKMIGSSQNSKAGGRNAIRGISSSSTSNVQTVDPNQQYYYTTRRGRTGVSEKEVARTLTLSSK